MDDVPEDEPAPTGRPPLPRRLVAAAVLSGSVAVIAGALAFGGGDDGAPEGGSSPPTTAPLTAIGLEPVPDVRGRAAPDVAIERFDGGELRLTDYEGTPLVVNFFASWCAPCVAEMPDFEEVHRALGDRVQILGVNLQEELEDAQAIVDQTGVTYDLALDRRGELYAALEGFSMPTTVFISADGEVVDVHRSKIAKDELLRRIEQHLL